MTAPTHFLATTLGVQALGLTGQERVSRTVRHGHRRRPLRKIGSISAPSACRISAALASPQEPALLWILPLVLSRHSCLRYLSSRTSPWTTACASEKMPFDPYSWVHAAGFSTSDTFKERFLRRAAGLNIAFITAGSCMNAPLGGSQTGSFAPRPLSPSEIRHRARTGGALSHVPRAPSWPACRRRPRPHVPWTDPDGMDGGMAREPSRPGPLPADDILDRHRTGTFLAFAAAGPVPLGRSRRSSRSRSHDDRQSLEVRPGMKRCALLASGSLPIFGHLRTAGYATGCSSSTASSRAKWTRSAASRSVASRRSLEEINAP